MVDRVPLDAHAQHAANPDLRSSSQRAHPGPAWDPGDSRRDDLTLESVPRGTGA